MSLPRIFLIVCTLLFGAIGVGALFKSFKKSDKESATQNANNSASKLEKVNLSEIQKSAVVVKKQPQITQVQLAQAQVVQAHAVQPVETTQNLQAEVSGSNEVETIQELFLPHSNCPIVETIKYSSRVSWKPKRAAWLIDYANHYKTPVDFILRSLNGGKSGKERPVSEGEHFCVLRSDREFSFIMVVALETCQMKLNYLLKQPDGSQSLRFVKQYSVGCGRRNAEKVSGSLTPLGIYRLGTRVAVFRPGMTGVHKGKKIELIQVFGTRWLPFEKEIADCTEPAKGFGIHGTPWLRTDSGLLSDRSESIGKFESDGCIRLKSQDIEELYSIISSRTGIIEIVPNFQQSKLLKGELVKGE